MKKRDNSLPASVVKKAINRDEQAVEALCRAKERSVLYICISMMKDKYDGEDLAQEVLTRMYMDIHKLRKATSLDSWLYQIVLGEYYKTMRKKVTEKEYGMGESICYVHDETRNFMPDEYLEDAEKRKAVMDMLDNLPPRNKACMLMYYYSDMTYAEISEALGLPKSDVNNLLHRSKERMRKTLQSSTQNELLVHFPAMVSLPVLSALMKQEAQRIPQMQLDTIWNTTSSLLQKQLILKTAANTGTAATATALKASAAKTGAAALKASAMAANTGTITALKATAVVAALAVTGTTGLSVHKSATQVAHMQSQSIVSSAPASSYTTPSLPPLLTVEDMIGTAYANQLYHFTQAPPSQEEMTQFVENTSLWCMQTGSGLYQDEGYKLYLLDVEDKRLMVIVREEGGQIAGVVYLFTSTSYEPPEFYEIESAYSEWR